MSTISDVLLEKAKKQRDRIRRGILEAEGATFELANHETIIPINMAWLTKNGLDVIVEKDRDGRIINIIDMSRLLEQLLGTAEYLRMKSMVEGRPLGTCETPRESQESKRSGSKGYDR